MIAGFGQGLSFRAGLTALTAGSPVEQRGQVASSYFVVAYLSISIPEFPNLFMLNGPNGPVGNFSLIDVAELQFGYITQLIERLADGYGEVCATRKAVSGNRTIR